MNSDVHPAVAGLVLAATIIAVALWAWGSGVAAGFGGPAELSRAPDGHSFIQIQNYLVEHDENGSYVRTHDLDALGVDLFLGGHAFFSNGDILLRRGSDPRSFMDNVRAYKRETNRHSIVPDAPGNGLFRCNLEERSCHLFGEDGIDFKASFSVYIDRQTDEVYISDTTRHLLRKYSSSGVEQATPAEGFEFPNQLMLHDGQLLVADTNNHVIRRLDPASTPFGEIIDNEDVVPVSAKQARQTWPSHFTRVGDEWWVNNMQTDMNRGGLYVFDEDWQFVRRIELPQDADPISILAVADSVWVTDWNNDVVRRFSTSGKALPNLESEGLKTVLSRSVQERRKYAVLSYSGVAVVAVMLLGLLVQAFAKTMNAAPVRKSAEVDSLAAIADSDPVSLEPDEAVKKRMTAAARLVMILTFLAIIPLAFLFREFEHPELVGKLVGPVAGLFAIAALIVWVNRANWGTTINLDGDTLTLRDYTGRKSTCPIRQVRYDNTAIATRDAVVFLGRPQNRIYPHEDIEQRLLPRLADAQRVGAIEMLKIQIELRHPQGLAAVVVIVGILIYGLSLLVM